MGRINTDRLVYLATNVQKALHVLQHNYTVGACRQYTPVDMMTHKNYNVNRLVDQAMLGTVTTVPS